MSVIARISSDKSLSIFDEIIEVDSTYFEDSFENNTRKQEWAFETWGASPETVYNDDSQEGWGIYRTGSSGHGSGALYIPMPNITKGKVVMEFVWRPYTVDNSYKGSFFRVRGNNISRNVYYGRTGGDVYLELSAYSVSNVSVTTGGTKTLSPSIFDSSIYRIEWNVETGEVHIFVNGELEHTFNVDYIQESFFEFSFGGYSGDFGTTFGDVSIMVDDNKPIKFTNDGKIYVKNIKEIDNALKVGNQGLVVNEIIEGGI